MQQARTLLLISVLLYAGVATALTCAEKGFKETKVLCSSCKNLEQFVNDAELIADCNSCCAQTADSASSSKEYTSAVLTVCNWKISRFPHIEEFVHKEAPKFPFFSVQYVGGADPVLELKDKEGKNLERLGIDNWKTEHLVAFLKEKFNV